VLARIKRVPSPALVISVIALIAALGGGAYALSGGEKAKVKKIAKRAANQRITKRAAGLSVAHAATADSATNATQLNGLHSSAFQARQPASWTPMTLNPGDGYAGPHTFCYWANFGGAFADASYLLDQDGFVHLRGLVQAKNEGNQTCGTIDAMDKVIAGAGTGAPLDYHPATQETFTVSSNDKPARVDIDASGNLFIELGYPSYADAMHWVSLDGITFRCAPSGAGDCP
jgi:hypothetical protein